MHDATSDIFALALGPLHNANEVINKDIHMCDRSSVFCKRDTIFRRRQGGCELCQLCIRGSGWQSVVPRLWQQQHKHWDGFGSHWTEWGQRPFVGLMGRSPAVVSGRGILEAVRQHSTVEEGGIGNVGGSLRGCAEGGR